MNANCYLEQNSEFVLAAQAHGLDYQSLISRIVELRRAVQAASLGEDAEAEASRGSAQQEVGYFAGDVGSALFGSSRVPLCSTAALPLPSTAAAFSAVSESSGAGCVSGK